MRILLCPIASHGFVYPAIAVAQALQRRGHTVAFATGAAFADTLARAGLDRIPRGARDGASFGIARWFEPMDVAIQVKHIEHAVRQFAPDALVTHPLALGPLIVRERTHLPVAVLGMAAYLWPASTAPATTGTARRLAGRYTQMMRHLNEARAVFKLGAILAEPAGSPLLGDLFLLQSVPELVDADTLPRHAHLVGACLWEPPAGEELEQWTQGAVASANPVVYLHHGSSFDQPSFWPAVVGALGGGPCRVVAAIGRMDRVTTGAPPNFYVRDHLCQGAVLRHARVAITGGNTTAALGAMTHGVPSLILPGGSEQPDVAELVARAGAGIVLPLGEATEHRVADAVRTLLASGEIAHRARQLAQAFARHDGPDAAARLIERLPAARAPVTRPDAAPRESVACP